MENRERDRVSQRATPTEAGQLNRSVEEEKGREANSGTSAEFGQSIGRSEKLEGGEMGNRNQDDLGNQNMGDESSRRSGSDSFGSSSGSDSRGSNSGNSEISGNKSSNRSSTGELGSTGSSEGRH